MKRAWFGHIIGQMARLSLAMMALMAASACGRTEREPLGSPELSGASGGAATSNGGSSGGLTGSSGLAGMGGLVGTSGLTSMGGSSQVQSAVSECEQYCETLDYRLPQALCEDWNRTGWEPPFCHLDPSAPCADYCREVYEAVSPTCAELLQPVIRCVAPSYAKPFITSCWLAECRYQLFTMTSACYGLQEKLAAARAAWEASRVIDYDLTYDWGGRDPRKAQVVVRAGREPVVTPADATVWTVPQLFDEVERSLHQPGSAPVVTYDAELGHVVDLRLLEQGCDGGSTLVTGVAVAPLR